MQGFLLDNIMNAGEIIYGALSDLVDGRVYPLKIPEMADDAPPYLVYTPISSLPTQTLDGISGDEWVRVQIDLYHDNYDECLNLYRQVMTRLQSALALKLFTGQSQTTDGVLYRISFDCEFWVNILS